MRETSRSIRRGAITKRTFDVIVGIPLLLVALPVIGVAAVVLAVQLRGSPFFVQERVGRHQRTFRMPKLRTLPRTTPEHADKTVAPVVAVSRFARFLRRSHIDELPQLLLVLTGRMSLVGPRPLMVSEAKRAPAEFLTTRSAVRPGCSGLWQVSTEQSARVIDAPEYDLWYLAHRGLRLDAWIMLRTLRQLAGPPTVGLDSLPHWVHVDRNGDDPARVDHLGREVRSRAV